jgi:hypothetical protein
MELKKTNEISKITMQNSEKKLEREVSEMKDLILQVEILEQQVVPTFLLLRATPPVPNMSPCKLKLDEEKPKYASLAPEAKWFCPSIFVQFAEDGKRHSKA